MSRDGVSSPVVTVVPYVLLAVLVLVTVPIGPDPVVFWLCGAAAAWMLGVFTLRPGWRTRPVVMAVFFTVLLAITAVLVVRAPWFGFFTPAAYFYAFRVLRWPWRLAGVGAVAVVAGTAQAYGLDKTTAAGLVGYLAILVVNVVPMCGFAWFAWRDGQQDEQRRQALADVREANRRLEAMFDENVRLAREAGVLDERQRMAREIHDTLAQGLTGIVTQLQAAEHDPVGWRRHVGAATALARESLSEARRSVRALRPEPLEAARLSEALAGVAAKWSARNGLTVEVTTTGTACPLPAEAEIALLRTAQEALANVARHANANRVGLTLSYLDGEVALDVRDDGRGFDPGGSSDGFGLVAMRQRVESLSGTLRVESGPGCGTGISARVPAVRS
ncbi:sensor histidine kinase [Amycolatopsis sp. K13G38]|uniref:Oxygen sensor histidine kinase NreB n=1 Tax=Amycolatopsis acididurans TaxID=2724524 RepID=A0ABX1IZ66_9PSEU|nr:sensor histidine kinase [Amycolatopsis acididurans]NKQ51400.1 sensor histidine kinase [Amycolatopsis acididurans]